MHSLSPRGSNCQEYSPTAVLFAVRTHRNNVHHYLLLPNEQSQRAIPQALQVNWRRLVPNQNNQSNAIGYFLLDVGAVHFQIHNILRSRHQTTLQCRFDGDTLLRTMVFRDVHTLYVVLGRCQSRQLKKEHCQPQAIQCDSKPIIHIK